MTQRFQVPAGYRQNRLITTAAESLTRKGQDEGRTKFQRIFLSSYPGLYAGNRNKRFLYNDCGRILRKGQDEGRTPGFMPGEIEIRDYFIIGTGVPGHTFRHKAYNNLI